MLKGVDVSKYQGQIDYSLLSQDKNFIIIRASAGVSYIDEQLVYNREGARKTDMVRGFYHYAQADKGNNPIDEAKHFCNTIQDLQKGELLALDFECQYNGDKVQWCSQFLTYVTQYFKGYMPLIYLNYALTQAHDWQPVSQYYPLWLADWRGYNPDLNPLPIGWTVPIKQFSDIGGAQGISGRVDLDSAVPDLKPLGYLYNIAIPIDEQLSQLQKQSDLLNAENKTLKQRISDANNILNPPIS